MHAFILAGGFATRLWPLTEKRAKPLLPLAGKPIITHIVEKIPAEIPVTVSTNEAFEESFLQWKKDLGRENIEILIEKTQSDDQKLGALGATAQWIRDASIDDDVLLLTGDNYFGCTFDAFFDGFNGSTVIAAHDIGSLEDAKKFGTVVLKEGSNASGGIVDAFDEKPPKPRSTLISTGCSILPKHTLPILLEYATRHPDNVGGIFEELLSKNEEIHCFVFSEHWFDIGSFDAYIDATKHIVGDELLCADTCHLDGNTHEGSVVLGHNATVKNSQLRDVVVFDDVSIDDCTLERCIIDNGSELHGIDLYGKMLREKTKLGT